MENSSHTATFAGGCFWGVQEIFDTEPGVRKTVVGYTGGDTGNPTYEQVCSGTTGHAEAIDITFDPAIVSYETLVRKFFALHNPTTLNRQGPDIGTQYRSAVFYHSPEQQTIAKKVRDDIDASGEYRTPVVTEITPAAPFYPAEEYHQQYNKKHGLSGCAL